MSLPKVQPEYIAPLWEQYTRGLVKDLYPNVPANFLRNPGIEGTMHTRGAKYTQNRIAWLEKYFRLDFDYLERMLHETAVGEPYISDERYMASDVTIGHLYHLCMYRHMTGNDLPERGTIIEWGGGYGNLARMVKMIHPGITYVIIDIPILTHVQHYYLNYHTETRIFDGTIKPGAVNLVPITSIASLDVSAQMFISTWALNESPDACGELLESKQWYGADQFLFAYLPGTHNCNLIEKQASKLFDCDGLPPNKYAMR